MKLLVVGILAAALSVLLTVAVLIGYHNDQQIIRWFPGTGIAGKLDVNGVEPAYVSIENERTGVAATVAVAADGSFIEPLHPGTYRHPPDADSRPSIVVVPD